MRGVNELFLAGFVNVELIMLIQCFR